ncbi:MAG: hypothetical protein JW909_01435 [Planctomycetes bacterium]|nr:hypothetical protein [Planctomycetota bacterium]
MSDSGISIDLIYPRQIAESRRRILGNDTSCDHAPQGIAVMRIIDAVHRSAETGRLVIL